MQAGVVAATIAQAGEIGNQGGSCNLKRFKAHDSPALQGGGGPMVGGHCFLLVGKDTGAAVTIIAQESSVAATIARTNATLGQGGTSKLQGFQAHHPLTYIGGGDWMVKTSLAIEREAEDTRSIRDMGASTKRKENQSSFSSRKKQETSVYHGDQGQGRFGASSQTRLMTCNHCH